MSLPEILTALKVSLMSCLALEDWGGAMVVLQVCMLMKVKPDDLEIGAEWYEVLRGNVQLTATWDMYNA